MRNRIYDRRLNNNNPAIRFCKTRNSCRQNFVRLRFCLIRIVNYYSLLQYLPPDVIIKVTLRAVTENRAVMSLVQIVKDLLIVESVILIAFITPFCLSASSVGLKPTVLFFLRPN